MSSRLTHFLIQLAEDPVKLQEFQRNPRQALVGARLSAAQRTAILSRSTLKIRKCLLPDGGTMAPVWVRPIQVVAQLRLAT